MLIAAIKKIINQVYTKKISFKKQGFSCFLNQPNPLVLRTNKKQKKTNT
jgi:hypothetical protein